MDGEIDTQRVKNARQRFGHNKLKRELVSARALIRQPLSDKIRGSQDARQQ